MTLQNKTPIRRCGHSWPDEQAAMTSKRYLTGSCEVVTGCPCGRVHLRPVKSALGKERKPAADTGPSRKTRALVAERDGHACVCCGHSVIGQPHDIQHRDSRGMGGTSDPAANSPSNLILMLRACHQRVESRADPEDNARGYWLRMGEDPALTPVMYFETSGSGVSLYLGADGSLSPDRPLPDGPAVAVRGGRQAGPEAAA